MSLSGSLSSNVEEHKRANHIIRDLEKECFEIAESVGLDKDIILQAAVVSVLKQSNFISGRNHIYIQADSRQPSNTNIYTSTKHR